MRTQIFILLVVVSVGVGSARADLIWDEGHYEFSEGNESEVYMCNDATADITGGTIGILWGQDSSSINVFDGSTIDLLRPNDYSEAKVYGGEIQVIFALGSSQTDVYGGTIDEIQDRSTVNLYTEIYEINPNGGS